MLLKNGFVFYKQRFRKLDIRISSKKILQISKSILPKPNEKILNIKDMYVIPGAIDLHVHFREPGQVYKEGIKNGSLCAAKGGCTYVYDMPNNKLPIISKKRYENKVKLAKKKAIIKFDAHYGINDSTIEKVFSFKPKTVKVYLAETTGNLLVKKQNIEKIIKLSKINNTLLFFHCEDSEILEKNKNKNSHFKRRPLSAELKCIKWVANLLKKHNSFAYFCHLTSAKSIKLLKKYDKRNICECTPAHLFLSTKDAKKIDLHYGKNFSNVNPPLRSESIRKELWENISQVDVIGTDHAPHTRTEKLTGLSGFPQIEFLIPLIMSKVFNKELSIKKAVSLTSGFQRKLLNLNASYIDVGHYADLCIVKKEEWIIDDKNIQSKADWTPFFGKKLSARVYYTLVNGKIIYSYN